ncbi:membrane protein insertase YidC [Alteromonadaceae bacterium BrNp21-10]|nr:membrane protein insertase YidC [Alteromonadaceae bacterium BrNp21-10]
MESQRNFLIVGLLFVSFLLWQQWQIDNAPAPAVVSTTEQSSVPSNNSSNMSNLDVPISAAAPITQTVTSADSIKIHVITDALDVLIDTKGGDIVSANLVDYTTTYDSNDTFSLLRQDPSSLYIAQSGLIGNDGPDASKQGRPIYQAVETSYQLTNDSLTVPLIWHSANGLVITKTFTFYAGQHHVDIGYDIVNNTGATANVQQYAQLKQSIAGPDKGSMFMPTYRGTAYSTEQTRYEKYDFEDVVEANLRETTPGGWVAMLEHYFVSAWIPPQDQTNTLFSRTLNGTYATIGYTGQPVAIEPGQQTQITSQLYIGPKVQDSLEHLAKGLDLTVDYGILFWLSQPLFALLKFIQSFVSNWGLAIIIITIIVKGAMYPLTKAQYVSMGKMKALKPKMDALKERYGDDRQKMSQGMMEMYKKEKVNPMGGCFPLLLQMPIFLSLYYVFLESVELRHAEFFGWIHDLSVQDPYYVLPILMGASMYLLQKLNPATMTDPMQQKIMQFMPVMMTVFFLWFPSGLVLYWLISNLITIAQAKIIYAGMEKKGMKIN